MFFLMVHMQANQGSILNTRESEANPSEEDENMTTLDKANPDSTLNTTEKTPEHVEETLQQVTNFANSLLP